MPDPAERRERWRAVARFLLWIWWEYCPALIIFAAWAGLCWLVYWG